MKFEVRFPLDYPVTLTKKSAKKASSKAKKSQGKSLMFMGKSFNLSRGGLGVRVPSKLQVKKDDCLELLLSYGDATNNESHNTIAMEVKVVWVDGDNCGLAITQISAENKDRYGSLLAGFEVLLEDDDSRSASDSHEKNASQVKAA